MRKGTWVLLLLMTACLLGGTSKGGAEQTELLTDTWLGSMESGMSECGRFIRIFEKEHPEIRESDVMTSSDEVIKKTKICFLLEGSDLILQEAGKIRCATLWKKKTKRQTLCLIWRKIRNLQTLWRRSSYWQKDRLPALSDVLLLGEDTGLADIFEKAGIESVPETWDANSGLVRKIRRAGHRMKEIDPVRIAKESSVSGRCCFWTLPKESTDAVENHSFKVQKNFFQFEINEAD